MARLNLLMLNYEFPPIGGGAANAHLAVLRQYAGNPDLKIDVLTSAPARGFSKEQFSENIAIYRVGVNKKNLHHWRKIEVVEWLANGRRHYRQLLERKEYDLAHAYFGFPTGWLCYRSSHKLPYMLSLRGSDVPGQHARLQLDYKILAPIFRSIWKNADAIVANSSGLKNRALDFLPSAVIDVIPNGVDLTSFSPAVNRPRDSTIRLITVGRLSVTKRVEMLVEAVRILSNGGLDVHLSVIGDGALKDWLKSLVAAAELNNRIEFAGRVDQKDIPRIYQKCDMFVSATLQEGMSNAMLEAMACGLPVVTTPCEGSEELIAGNGIVVGESSAQAISSAVKSIVEDDRLYRRMSVMARSRAEQFDWKAVADEYLKMYFDVKRRRTPDDAV